MYSVQNPGAVQNPPRASKRPALYPISSCSSLCAASSGDSPGSMPPCRSFQQVFAYRVPVLSNEQRPARLIDGQDDHCVGVLGHLSGRPLAVGQLDLVDVELDHPPVEHVTAPDRAFRLHFPAHGVTARHTTCDGLRPSAASGSSRRRTAGRPAGSSRCGDSS